jgi:hypothetical protein
MFKTAFADGGPLAKLVMIYLAIGQLLSIPLIVSYLYAMYSTVYSLGWAFFSISGQSTFGMLMVLLVFGVFLRVTLWLPSLVMWQLYYEDTFLQWLAPGFWVGPGIAP